MNKAKQNKMNSLRRKKNRILNCLFIILVFTSCKSLLKSGQSAKDYNIKTNKNDVFIRKNISSLDSEFLVKNLNIISNYKLTRDTLILIIDSVTVKTYTKKYIIFTMVSDTTKKLPSSFTYYKSTYFYNYRGKICKIIKYDTTGVLTYSAHKSFRRIRCTYNINPSFPFF